MADKKEISDAAARKAEAAAAAEARARVTTGANEQTNEASPSRLKAEAGGSARNTVTVGCMLPHGLILELDELGQTDEGKPIWKGTGLKVTLNGANASRIIGGYGLTQVDADFWEKWKAQKRKFPALVAGLIFEEITQERAIAHAIDATGISSGFEPLNPDKPGQGIQRVPEADRRAAAGLSGYA